MVRIGTAGCRTDAALLQRVCHGLAALTAAAAPSLRVVLLSVGAEENGGGILYMVDVEGRPLVDCTVTANGKLWWPHTEALVALVLAYTRTRDAARWPVERSPNAPKH